MATRDREAVEGYMYDLNSDSGRARKFSEKGMQYNMEQLDKKYKSLCRSERYLKEIATEDDEPLDIVRKKYSMWMSEFEKYLELYDILLPQVSSHEHDEFAQRFNENYGSAKEFKSWIENYISSRSAMTLSKNTLSVAEELSVAGEKIDQGIIKKTDPEADDNVSVSSTASSYASLKRIKEEQVRVELETRKLALSKKHEIELAKLSLKLKEEELELDTGIAVAQARSGVLDKYDSNENLNASVDQALAFEQPRFTSPKPRPLPVRFTDESVCASPPPVLYDRPRPHTTGVAEVSSRTLPEQYVDSSHSQTVVQSVVQHLRKPVAEVKKFSGDPLEYRRFIRQFHSKVVINTDDDDERMNYLEQLTFGDAHKVVSGFSHLNGDKAYKAAMSQLEDRYGDEEVIATAFIKKALDWPTIRPGDPKALDDFSLFLVECDNAVGTESNGVLDYSDNIKKLMLKLPFYLHDKWRNQVYKYKEAKRKVRFQDFMKFVKAEAKKVNDPTYGSNATGTSRPKTQTKIARSSNAVPEIVTDSIPKSTSDTVPPPAPNYRCFFCDSTSHSLDTCKKITAKPMNERVNFIKEKGLCFGCLKKGHLSKRCRNRSKCGICNKSHPSILHNEESSSVVSVSNASTGYAIAKEDQKGDLSCAMAIVPVRIRLRDKPHSIETYAFLDTGSSASFCTETVMKQLGARGKKTQLTLSTMGEPFIMNTFSISGLQVSDIDSENAIDLPRVFTKEKMPVSKKHIPTQAEVSRWEHLAKVSLAEPNCEIGLMIGSNVPDAYSPIEILAGPSGSPHATRTKLGWVVWNVLRESGTIQVNRVHIQDESGEDIEDMVKRSMNLDFPERLIDDRKENSREDKQFLDMAENSIYKDGEHYCVSLPFRNMVTILPDNSVMAKRRLRSIENRFKADPKFKEDYTTFMETLLEKGHAEPAPVGFDKGKVWYIPHHGVYHKKKNKIRVVFDCSARYQGVSLNDNLLQGPDLTNNLLGVLMRFREEPVAVIGDIEAMFYQVKVPVNERDYLRFYWWPNGNTANEPRSYRMTVHLFGASSSPSVCNFALQKTAEDSQERFPQEVQDTLKRNMYVDDCLTSVATEKKAISLIHDVTQMCKSGGFRLTKWTSNSDVVVESIPEGDRAQEVKLRSLDSKPPIERALGVYWFMENDSLGFQIQMKDKPVTRRGILSVTSSVYDPLGIASPFVLKAKSILQRLCGDGKGWDEEITGKDLKDWTDWLLQLPELEHVTIDRCYKGKNLGKVTSCQLHGFADASDIGYGMVFYLRLVDVTGKIHCSFLFGKARVAPLKAVTIPRMELTAASSLVKLVRMVTEQLNYNIDRFFFWTDSTSVLRYIANKNLRFHTFVANRIALIHEATSEDDWYYINTKENPADVASRGTSISKLPDSWTRGPMFLWKSEREWPVVEKDVKITDKENDPEIRTTACATSVVLDTNSGVENLFDYYSNFNKLRRATGWLMRAMDNLQGAVERSRQIKQDISSSESDPVKRDQKIKLTLSKERQDRLLKGKKNFRTACLSVDILERAEAALIKYEQRKYFAAESRILHQGNGVQSRKLKKTSKLFKMEPFVKDGVIRVGGRLERAEISYDAKHPVVLPREPVVSRLVVDDAHRSCGHLGKNTVLAFIREKYWIVGARTLVKSILSKCVTCRKYRAPCVEQKMANLPAERLAADQPPFSRTGMDFFGPFELKRGRSVKLLRRSIQILASTPFDDLSLAEENLYLLDRITEPTLSVLNEK
ncbi:uncharacterized protein LOC117340586 [Pecten maximus]|uniref:uncharacterized protein LOC117340586 n=1 Tax=Pecten maximus TaxID=6579 RepID=UPI0014586A04|nr:uncharacterized protein LOC117340586 [Pecten maximus]